MTSGKHARTWFRVAPGRRARRVGEARPRVGAGLSIAHDYHPTAAGKALRAPWPALEAIIAREIGARPWDIWPSRYTTDGEPTARTRR